MNKSNPENFPLISIIVPIYNSEDYLSMCITSLMKQSYSNIEIILINDGSTDTSGTICDNFRKLDERITLILQENAGVSSARNKGLDCAKGDFIAYVDSDDYVALDYIQSLYTNIDGHDISICGYTRVDNTCHSRNMGLDYISTLTHDSLYHYVLCNNYIGGYLWNKLFHSSIIIQNNIRFNTDLAIGEDMLWISEYLKFSNSGFYISSPLYFYRNNETSALQNSYKSKLFNKKNISNLTSADLIFAILTDESESVHAFMSYRYVRTSMWLLFNMITCSYYDKMTLRRIQTITRANLLPYMKANESRLLEKLTAIGIAISSSLTFSGASLLYKWLPDSFIKKYLN